jgi:hypothetical protein
MTAVLTRRARDVRRARQERIERLLAEVANRRAQLYRLKAAGVQRAALGDAKQELSTVRRDLHDAVASTGTSNAPPTFMKVPGHVR